MIDGGRSMHQAYTALPGIPDVESPLFEKLLRLKEISPETEDVARRLRRDGFAVISFPDPDFDEVATRIIRALHPLFDLEAWRIGREPSLRVQDAWRSNSDVRRLAVNPGILALLGQLYGREAFPFQTLNFPVGTEQHFHSDCVHFNSCPERFMAGVWVALEDTDSENGPLIYYPGTHTLPIYTAEHVGVNPDTTRPGSAGTRYHEYENAWKLVVEALDLKPLEFHAKKGEALIWAANLLHGGAAQKDKTRTRYSQVSHYYFRGCCYYTPLLSVPMLGPISFKDVVDVQTAELVPNELNGRLLSREHMEYTLPPRHRLVDLPAGFDPVAYLKANPDVAAANVDPERHWRDFGWRENRPLR
jgi:hypothetical protein